MNILRKNVSLLVLLGLFNIAAIFIAQNIYHTNFTGDEPHYVVMSSAIADYGTFEQYDAYLNEFKNREIYPDGFSEPPKKNKKYEHAVVGPHGLYNVHNIGLPLIIAPIYKIFGVNGIKIFMIFMFSISIPLLWIFMSKLRITKTERILIITATIFAFPFLTAANQVYSSFLSSTISILSIIWILYRPEIIQKKLYILCQSKKI